MADDEKEGEVITSRGADWEVVSLTASTYAAAPNPKGFEPDDDEDGSKQESSSAMFMSDHFLFPPSEHENLPVELDCSEIHNEPDNEPEGQDITFTEEEVAVQKQYKVDGDSQGTEFLDNGSTFDVHATTEFERSKGFQGLNSVPDPESIDIADPSDYSNEILDAPLKTPKSSEGDDYDESRPPCVSRWKKHASSLYRHAKEANTFWSIFVAAALTGLVILGKRWQRDKWHVQELRRQLNINNEKMNAMMGPIGRLKKIIIGSHQGSPLIGGGVAASH